MKRVMKSLTVGSVVLVGIVASTAAMRAGTEHGSSPRPIPAPDFASISIASRATILQYARSLTFDSSYHAADSRRLMLRRNGAIEQSALVTVAPEIGVTAMTFAEMRTGRILMRVTAQAAVPEHGLAAGDNFIWVDETGGKLRALIIPKDPNAPVYRHDFEIVHANMGLGRGPAEARFRWNDVARAEWIWVRCGDGCCWVSPTDKPISK